MYNCIKKALHIIPMHVYNEKLKRKKLDFFHTLLLDRIPQINPKHPTRSPPHKGPTISPQHQIVDEVFNS